MKQQRESFGKRNDLSGQRFGRLVASKDVGSSPHKIRMWLCKCDCGAESTVASSDLRSGHTRSCGCYNIDRIQERNFKHGSCFTRLHKTWTNMKSRCYTRSATRFSEYGGRGITVCKEWKDDFSSFRLWAESTGYTEKMTIERREVNGNYVPDNCIWIPLPEQSRNTTKTIAIEINGVTRLQSEWLDLLNISKCAFYSRRKAGMQPKDIILELRDKKKSVRSKSKIKEVI
jgi:hypothetical protein